jgi:hypothetical protein
MQMVRFKDETTIRALVKYQNGRNKDNSYNQYPMIQYHDDSLKTEKDVFSKTGSTKFLFLE